MTVRSAAAGAAFLIALAARPLEGQNRPCIRRAAVVAGLASRVEFLTERELDSLGGSIAAARVSCADVRFLDRYWSRLQEAADSLGQPDPAPPRPCRDTAMVQIAQQIQEFVRCGNMYLDRQITWSQLTIRKTQLVLRASHLGRSLGGSLASLDARADWAANRVTLALWNDGSASLGLLYTQAALREADDPPPLRGWAASLDLGYGGRSGLVLLGAGPIVGRFALLPLLGARLKPFDVDYGAAGRWTTGRYLSLGVAYTRFHGAAVLVAVGP